MTRSIVDIRDDSNTGHSPCVGCHNLRNKISKDVCMPVCERIKASQNGDPFGSLPYPNLSDTDKYLGCDNILEPKENKKIVEKGDVVEKQKVDKEFPEFVRLRLRVYPEIVKYIISLSKEMMLPYKNTVVMLLSEAIMARNKKNK